MDKHVYLKKPWRRLWLVVAVTCMGVGVYLLVLVLSPATHVPGVSPVTAIDLNTSDDKDDQRNRIQIERMNLEVPFFEGGAESLDKGAWHRYPERGNPKNGGNFILSAHRFNIGLTPVETKVRSPFYKLDELKPGDSIRIFYDQAWYDYTVSRLYSVKPDAVEIESPSNEAKLTLYSCSLSGSADGRYVVEAHLKT